MCTFNRAPTISEVGVGQARITHDATLRAWLQILIAVYRDNRPSAGRNVSVNVVSAVDACQSPAALFEDAAHPFAGDGLHGASPTASRARPSSWATASQPSAASRRLARTSSSVSPWVWHPGSAGIDAEYPPASVSGRTIALIFTTTSTTIGGGVIAALLMARFLQSL